MSEALVSVILPVYNREGWVGRAIESVLAQTYPAVELIVIDDGSTDATRAVLERFGSRITVLEQQHAGAYAARNLGLRHARGEFVAFLDSDDAWLPDRLSVQMPLMQRAETALVFGDVAHLTADGVRTRLTSFRVAPPRRGRVAERFAWANFIPTSAVLVRRRCLDEAGGFPEAPLSADYLLWFRIALAHDVDYVERVVAEYTVHDDGISHDLGRSLSARIDLFSAELARAAEPSTRRILRRLLFNTSLRLAVATIRGLARNVVRPLRLAWRTAAGVAKVESIPWMTAFAGYELRLRATRLFS